MVLYFSELWQRLFMEIIFFLVNVDFAFTIFKLHVEGSQFQTCVPRIPPHSLTPGIESSKRFKRVVQSTEHISSKYEVHTLSQTAQGYYG